MVDPNVTPQTFVETLANLNAVANQQTMQVLQIAALAMQLKNLGELDPTQAVLESKMASLLNTGGRAMARPSPITEVKS
jgi:hypothetical protein